MDILKMKQEEFYFHLGKTIYEQFKYYSLHKTKENKMLLRLYEDIIDYAMEIMKEE